MRLLPAFAIAERKQICLEGTTLVASVLVLAVSWHGRRACVLMLAQLVATLCAPPAVMPAGWCGMRSWCWVRAGTTTFR